MSRTSPIFRRPIPDNHDRVMAVMVDRWRGRDPRAMLPRISFKHLRSSSPVVEHVDQLVGFTLGPGDEVIDGLPAHHDAAGVGPDSVVLVLRLDEETSQ